MKNTKVELKDNELEEVNGGNFIVFASNTEPVDEEEPTANIVGFFPALPAFP